MTATDTRDPAVVALLDSGEVWLVWMANRVYCPRCNYYSSHGHASDCELDTLLRKAGAR